MGQKNKVENIIKGNMIQLVGDLEKDFDVRWIHRNKEWILDTAERIFDELYLPDLEEAMRIGQEENQEL